MNDEDTTKIAPEPARQDWSRFDSMTEAERHAAALGDPDAQPLMAEDMTRMPRTPQVQVVERALKLSRGLNTDKRK